jgi:hypothetical protein
VTETTEATARRRKNICERCFQFDDHPKHVIAVTAEGPLGLHSAPEVASVMQKIASHLPPNIDEISQMDADAGKRAVEALPDDQQDAMLAVAYLLDPTTAILHMDCFDELPEELKPQRSIYAATPDGEVISHEDKTKISNGAHATEGVRRGLKGKKLAEHLTSQPTPEEH